MRSPGRAGSSSATPGYGTSAAGAASSSSANASTAFYQPNRPYSNMNYNRPAVNGSAGPSTSHIHSRTAGSSSSSSHTLPQRPSGTNGYGAALNSQIPTSLPVPLPPKSAIAGQPAIPMNFKPSPFFSVISAVSTVVTLPSELMRSLNRLQARRLGELISAQDQRTPANERRQWRMFTLRKISDRNCLQRGE